MRDPVETVSLPLSSKESPDRGRTHLEEKSPGLLIDAEMSMHREVLHEEGHASCQTDRTQERAGCPDTDQCLLDCGTVPGRTVPVDMLRGISHEDTVSQEVPLTCLVQNTGGILPLVPLGLTEVVQHHRLLGLPCSQVRLCLDHGEFFPFSHRELHSRCSFLISRISSILSSFRYFFS